MSQYPSFTCTHNCIKTNSVCDEICDTCSHGSTLLNKPLIDVGVFLTKKYVPFLTPFDNIFDNFYLILWKNLSYNFLIKSAKFETQSVKLLSYIVLELDQFPLTARGRLSLATSKGGSQLWTRATACWIASPTFSYVLNLSAHHFDRGQIAVVCCPNQIQNHHSAIYWALTSYLSLNFIMKSNHTKSEAPRWFWFCLLSWSTFHGTVKSYLKCKRI